MLISDMQFDPLNSPHPVPWNWVRATQANSGGTGSAVMSYYRSQSLLSPDRRYAAYSRIQFYVHPEPMRSQIRSTLFLEDTETKTLQVIAASSPLASQSAFESDASSSPGSIAILIPIAWSATGDRILAREFESLFCSDIASDYAVIWERQSNTATTVAPQGDIYTTAILLGWSRSNPNHVLFQAGELGSSDWLLWQVDRCGQTTQVMDDEPLIFGQVSNHVWAGPQHQQLAS